MHGQPSRLCGFLASRARCFAQMLSLHKLHKTKRWISFHRNHVTLLCLWQPPSILRLLSMPFGHYAWRRSFWQAIWYWKSALIPHYPTVTRAVLHVVVICRNFSFCSNNFRTPVSGAFAELHKATIKLRHVCPSVRPHENYFAFALV